MKLSINNVDLVTLSLKSRAQKMKPALQQAAKDGIDLIVAQLAVYPAQKPNSRYKRTGNFALGWTGTPTIIVDGPGLGLIATRTNPVPYGRYLEGDQQKASNAGVWPLVKATSQEPQIKEQVKNLFLAQIKNS